MGMGGIAGGGAHRMVCSGGGVARPICSAPYGPSAEAKSARLTSWWATAARTVRVCAHLPRAFMHPGLGACVPCGASCSGGPALAYPISGGGASCHRPVPAASRFWARRDARSKGGVLSSAGGRTKQQQQQDNVPETAIMVYSDSSCSTELGADGVVVTSDEFAADMDAV